MRYTTLNMHISEELVVLVNEANEMLGTMPKARVHGAETPLHRAFSCFLFNDKGEFLLQQRSHKKKTWPLMWSNSVCGHPMPDEDTETAVRRRAQFELGVSVENLRFVSPYRYKAVKDGVMENEICPIFCGRVTEKPQPNSDEIEALQWMLWSDFVDEIHSNPELYSVWCREEAAIIEALRRKGDAKVSDLFD